jgi:diguanylate cyclase (GGDEF)-like protein
LAHFDALTGLANRLLLTDRFKRALANAQRHGEGLAVYFIDLDKFKAINDTHGHHVGDEVLRAVARRLLHGCRASDTVARLGGDEFVVLRSGPPGEAGPLAFAARLRVDLEAPCEIEGLHLTLSVGIGISTFPQDGNDERTLLENADTALYVAKASGSGSIRRFESDTAAGRSHSPNLARRPRLDVSELSAASRPLGRPPEAALRADADARLTGGKPIL